MRIKKQKYIEIQKKKPNIIPIPTPAPIKPVVANPRSIIF